MTSIPDAPPVARHGLLGHLTHTFDYARMSRAQTVSVHQL